VGLVVEAENRLLEYAVFNVSGFQYRLYITVVWPYVSSLVLLSRELYFAVTKRPLSPTPVIFPRQLCSVDVVPRTDARPSGTRPGHCSPAGRPVVGPAAGWPVLSVHWRTAHCAHGIVGALHFCSPSQAPGRHGDQLLRSGGVHGDAAVEVRLRGAHLHRHREALQRLVTAHA
jgi:hypothetical protein